MLSNASVVFGEAPESDDEVQVDSSSAEKVERSKQRWPSRVGGGNKDVVQPSTASETQAHHKQRNPKRKHSVDLLHQKLAETRNKAQSDMNQLVTQSCQKVVQNAQRLRADVTQSVAIVEALQLATYQATEDLARLKAAVDQLHEFRGLDCVRTERKITGRYQLMAEASADSVPCFEDFHKNLAFSLASAVESYSQEFAALSTDIERFAYVWKLPCVQKFDLKSWKISSGKDNGKAVEARTEGNTSYRSGELLEAMVAYNSSLVLAEIPSKEMALALSNRSAILKQWDLPEQAVADCKWALSAWVEDHKTDMPDIHAKLTNRIKECEEIISKRPEKPAANDIMSRMAGMSIAKNAAANISLPVLCGGAQTSMPAACTKIELRNNAEIGRHLVATEDIRPGEVLFVERPFARVLLPEAWMGFCQKCMKKVFTPPRPLPCPTCTRVVFCSSECADSDSQHQYECRLLSVFSDEDNFENLGKMGLLAFRTVAQVLRSPESLSSLLSPPPSTNYESSVYWNTYRLVTNTVHRKVGDIFRRASIAAFLVKLLEAEPEFGKLLSSTDGKINSCTISAALGAPPSLVEATSWQHVAGSLLLTHLQNMPCNAHEITCLRMGASVEDMGMEEIGAAAYPVLSLLNHSCDPNVVRHSIDDLLVGRAIRPIKKGEELVDNYGKHYAMTEKSSRQQDLQRQYFFECKCRSCEAGWPKYVDLTEEVTIPPNNPFEQAFKKVLNQEDYSDDVQKVFVEFLEFLDRNYAARRPFKQYNDCQEALKQCFGFCSTVFCADDYKRSTDQAEGSTNNAH